MTVEEEASPVLGKEGRGGAGGVLASAGAAVPAVLVGAAMFVIVEEGTLSDEYPAFKTIGWYSANPLV